MNRDSRPAAPGWTLIEMLTVLAILVLLVGLLMPSLQSAREASRTAHCASNLNQLRAALTVNPQEDPYSMLPVPERWVNYVFGKDVGAATICPSDGRDDLGPAEFENLTIRQRSWPAAAHPDDPFREDGPYVDTTIDDLLTGAVADDQVSYYYGGSYAVAPWIQRNSDARNINSWTAWVVDRLNAAYGPGISEPTDVPDNVAWVTIEMSGMVTFEFNDDITVTSHRKAGTKVGSDHWVIQDDEVKLMLGGEHSSGDTGSFTLPGGVLSYGMNTQVRDDRARGPQILLLDYHKTLADRDPAGNGMDDLAEHFAPRHHGRANVLRVDGSITRLSRSEVADDALWVGPND